MGVPLKTWKNCVVGLLVVLSGCQSDSEIPACVEHQERVELCALADIDCVESLSQECTYGDIEVTLNSCDCDSWVYGPVCDAGIGDSLEAIQSGTECGEWF